MKYIRIYEGFGEEPDPIDYKDIFIMNVDDTEYYKNLDYQEWYTYRHNTNNLHIPSNISLSLLKDIQSHCEGEYDRDCWRSSRNEFNKDTLIYSTSYSNPINKKRYTRQLWVWVWDEDWYIVSDVSQFGGETIEVSTYKCDQADGFIQLLKDKKLYK